MGDNLSANDLLNQVNTLKDKLWASEQYDFQEIQPDIANIITHLERDMLLTQENNSLRLSTISSLCDLMHLRFEFKPGEYLQYLDLALQCETLAVTHTPNDDDNLPDRLTALGILYLNRGMRMDDVADIDKAIGLHIRAISLTREGHPQLPHRLNHLGISHSRRFERLRNPEDIDKAIEYHLRAQSLVPKYHPDMLQCLNCLGASYGTRFGHLREPRDIARAIEYHTQTVSLTPEGHPDMPGRLNNLGVSHGIRFELVGEPRDIDKAIEYQTRAVSLAPEGHPELPGWLNILGSSYVMRFRHLGQLKDIDKAIEYHSQGISLTPEDHPGAPSFLGMLGDAYLNRFERLGQLGDIDQAIELLTQAVSLAPDGQEPAALSTLGNAYTSRFDRLGDLGDIDKGIEYHTRAVLLAPDNHNNKPGWLLNLGISHRTRFKNLGRLEDIDSAIEYHTQAALLAPKGHPFMPGWLNNLGDSHRNRFERLGRLEDIDKAIECQAQAVSLAPEGHMEMSRWLNNLGSSHSSRYQSLGQAEDIEKAIKYHAQAVSLAPSGHASLPRWLSDLGNSYLNHFKNTDDAESLTLSLNCFKKSAQCTTGRSRDKFNAACEWARLAQSHATSEQLEAYRVAMNLLPQLVWLGVTVGKRYHDVKQIGDIALKAAAAAIGAQEHGLAVEWLEQGRSIVWNQTLELRTPLERLRTVNPALSSALAQLARELHDAGSQAPTSKFPLHDTNSLEVAAQKHHRLAELYEQLVSRARLIPGFEDFLRPKKWQELVRAARTGPVVIVNVSRARCDALIMLPGKNDITHLAIPEISHDMLSDARDRLEESLQHGDVRERGFRKSHPKHEEKNAFEQVLALLWRNIAKPVLDSLGYIVQPNVDDLPHITWCTTGPLSFLPLHAAGDYDQPNSKLSDFVISSHTPTLSALLSISTSRSETGVLAVGQAATPGHNALPETVAELASIKKHVQAPLHYTQIDGYKATASNVLALMEEHSWIHLACHAQQNISNPTESGFFLHESSLSLVAIAQRSFKNKGLAFLSACQTAMGDEEIADEAVHLASGMLMAGYPSVIATMWSILDQDAPLIADKVYGQLLKDGQMKHEDAAKALHIAVGDLRAKVGEKEFARWVPYIHIGA